MQRPPVTSTADSAPAEAGTTLDRRLLVLLAGALVLSACGDGDDDDDDDDDDEGDG